MPEDSSTIAGTVSSRAARSESADVPTTATGSLCRAGAGNAPSPNTSTTPRRRQASTTSSPNARQRKSGSGPSSSSASRSPPGEATSSSVGDQVTSSMVPPASRTTGRRARKSISSSASKVASGVAFQRERRNTAAVWADSPASVQPWRCRTRNGSRSAGRSVASRSSSLPMPGRVAASAPERGPSVHRRAETRRSRRPSRTYLDRHNQNEQPTSYLRVPGRPEPVWRRLPMRRTAWPSASPARTSAPRSPEPRPPGRRWEMRRVAILLPVVVLAAMAVGALPAVAAPGRAARAEQAARIDFNGDGFDDLAVGAQSEAVGSVQGAGAVNVLFGSADGLVPSPAILVQGSGGVGGSVDANDTFGAALAQGLFNDDDFFDLAVGSPGEADGGASAGGAVNILYGSAAGLTGGP